MLQYISATPDNIINYDNADNYNNGVRMKIKAVHFSAPDFVLKLNLPLQRLPQGEIFSHKPLFSTTQNGTIYNDNANYYDVA